MSSSLSSFPAKKKWGQHFLHDEAVLSDIVKAVGTPSSEEALLEVGPGKGALTEVLVAAGLSNPFYLVEIDSRCTPLLRQKYGKSTTLIEGDFLEMDLTTLTSKPMVLVGNLPYNISSPIFFKVFAARQQVRKVICMVQKEVGLRLTARPGSKTYGILSVLLGAFYKRSYLFSVPPTAFSPPPKVWSGVIMMERNEREALDCDEKLFIRIVKQGFQQRRKMMRNALLPLGLDLKHAPEELLSARAEKLSVEDFIRLTHTLTPS